MYFCNKKFTLISKETNLDLYKKIKYELVNNLNISYNETYEEININHNNDFSKYLVTTMDENVMYLLLTTIDNIKYSFFYIAEQNEFYSVKMRFHKSLYNGTLIKGDILKNEKECWIYYLSDIYFYKSKYINKSKLSSRIKTIGNLIKNEYIYDDFLNPFHLQLKSYFLLNHIGFIKANTTFLLIPEYNNMARYQIILGNETIIEDVQVGGEKSNRKFKIIQTDLPDVYELYDNKFHSIACVSKMETSKFLKSLFKNNDSNRDIYVECEFSQNFNSWIPIRQI